ncbi:hypothetical protein ACM66B_005300 [Microbotryomycetes sp. NB124-2]
MNAKRRARDSLSPTSDSTDTSTLSSEVQVKPNSSPRRGETVDRGGDERRDQIEREPVEHARRSATRPSAPTQPVSSPLKALKAIVEKEIKMGEEAHKLSSFQLTSICNTVLRNKRLVELAREQTLSPHGRITSNSALTALVRLVNGDESLLSLNSVDLVTIARALGLYDREDDVEPSSTTIDTALDPTLALMCLKTTCIQCNSPLSVLNSDTSLVWLADANSLKRATALKLACSSVSGCGALHSPDHVEIRQNEQRLWIFDSDCQYLRVGRQIFVTRKFAESFLVLLESHYVSTSGFATMFNKLYATPEGFQLTSKHVWRAFVLHALLDKSKKLDQQLVCPAESSTYDLVALALGSTMKSKVLDGAKEHQCPECSRYKRSWKDGVIADDESKLVSRKRKDYAKELTKIDKSRIVNLAVLDGIKIGHRLCAKDECTDAPATSNSLFCFEHRHSCQIRGCPGTISKDSRSSRTPATACKVHAQDSRSSSRRSKTGPPRKRARQEKSSSESSESSFTDDSSSEASNQAESEQLRRVKARQIPGIQLLVYACGTLIAWHKLETPEEPDEILSFLDKVDRDTNGGLPTFVAYDRSCQLLAHVADRARASSSSSSSSSDDPSANSSADTATTPPAWLDRTKLIVDAFHFTTHSKDDVLCRAMCNPAPLDGSQPDLVTPHEVQVPTNPGSARRTHKGSRQMANRIEFCRTFNTSAAEQLNSWLKGFANLLGAMSADNHDFLLQVLLERRFASRAQTLKDRYGNQTVG